MHQHAHLADVERRVGAFLLSARGLRPHRGGDSVWKSDETCALVSQRQDADLFDPTLSPEDGTLVRRMGSG